jgi:hypothetical protein
MMSIEEFKNHYYSGTPSGTSLNVVPTVSMIQPDRARAQRPSPAPSARAQDRSLGPEAPDFAVPEAKRADALKTAPSAQAQDRSLGPEAPDFAPRVPDVRREAPTGAPKPSRKGKEAAETLI